MRREVVASGREKDQDGDRCTETNHKEWFCFFCFHSIFLFQKIRRRSEEKEKEKEKDEDWTIGRR